MLGAVETRGGTLSLSLDNEGPYLMMSLEQWEYITYTHAFKRINKERVKLEEKVIVYSRAH